MAGCFENNKMFPRYAVLIYLIAASCSSNRCSASTNGIANSIARLLFEPSSSSDNFFTIGNSQIKELNGVTPSGKGVTVDVEGNNNTIVQTISSLNQHRSACQLVHVAHLLRHAGCQPKAIASFACKGTCPSYVQTSTSRFWQHERSCSCCQQTGLKEATFTLDCPELDPPYKRVKTHAPVDCLCRACTDLAKEDLRPQELVEVLSGSGDIAQ